MNSWKASLFPACEPPLMTLKEGTGSMRLELPARSAKCWYRGTPFAAAPALDSASEAPRMALAPRRALFSVPSRLIMMSSSSACCVGSLPNMRRNERVRPLENKSFGSLPKASYRGERPGSPC
eukprot:scaffold7358_cov252-Pinguiococcus_pyrenoidosus.AAC.28